MVDYGSGGGPSTSKTSWVCPNDRHLALRAKLRKGWSVKTQQEECFPRQSVKLDEHEQDMIRAVIKRAEELEHQEQERLGRIIERLDTMRRNAVGTGVNQCILCGTQLFFLGLITTSCLVCYDCKKAICQKCAVECLPYIPLRLKPSRASKASQASSSKKGSIWRCKICAETREMWKKSGAWFVKGVPKYILPPKKPPPPEGKYSPGRRVCYEKSNWARALSARPSEGEEESSSDEDRATKFLASRKKKTDDKTQNQYLRHGFLAAFTWFYRVLVRQAHRIFNSFSASYCRDEHHLQWRSPAQALPTKQNLPQKLFRLENFIKEKVKNIFHLCDHYCLLMR